MFDSKTNLAIRITDATDLLIDFATLGEYGLEPPAKPTATCEARHRPTPPATKQRRRPGAPTLVLAIEKPAPRRRHHIDGPFLLRP
jgi:hypothetical protein